MAFLSPRFVILACLCAALPFALPNAVEVAHLHGSRSVDKHTYSRHGLYQTRTDFIASQPAGLHGHGDESDGHEHDHRSSNLPPLLRRYRVPDRGEVYKPQAQDLREDVDQVPKSAFARSRYRRGPALYGHRSSIYVSGEHGNKYIVTRIPRDGYKDPDAQFSDTRSRRQLNEDDRALGRIDIMSFARSPGQTKRLASLMVDATPIDWSSGQSSAMAFQLNASIGNQTQFIMVPTDDAAAGNTNKYVTLATEVFDATSAAMLMYCATYDPNPGSTSPLLMTPCVDVAQPAAADDSTTDSCDAENASLSDPHQSQIFSYDPLSGTIEPISATTNTSNLAPCAEAKIRRDGSSAGTTKSASNTSTSTAPIASTSQQAEKVTLVYVAGAPEVPANGPSAGAVAAANVTSTARASNGQVAILTTTRTLTTTVVSTVTDASDRTVSPARAAVTVSASVPSTTTAVPSSARTPSPAATSSRLENANESLEVEVVGISTPSAASSSSMTTGVATTASSSSVSAPLDAAAVASSIANVMPHRRRAVAQVTVSVVR